MMVFNVPFSGWQCQCLTTIFCLCLLSHVHIPLPASAARTHTHPPTHTIIHIYIHILRSLICFSRIQQQLRDVLSPPPTQSRVYGKIFVVVNKELHKTRASRVLSSCLSARLDLGINTHNEIKHINGSERM